MRGKIGVKGAVATYLGLVCVVTSPFYYLVLHAGTMGAGRRLYIPGLMWSPALAALLTVAILRRPASSLGWRWGPTRYYALGYLIPIAYGAVAYGIAWATGLAGFGNPTAVASIARDFGWAGWPAPAVIVGYVLLEATVGFVMSCATALGEEIGWRGFLVPELARTMSFTGVSIVSGLAWAVYHYPILIFGDYNAGTPAWFGLTCFTVEVVAISFVFTWLRLRSGNLWTAMVLHASHNLFIQAVFDEFTGDNGWTKYATGEFGAVLALAIGAAGFLAWRARHLVEPTGRGAASPAETNGLGS